MGSKNDGVNAPVAGFLSALSLAMDGGKRRELLCVLTASRAIDTTICIAEESGTIPNSPHRNMILFAIANTFLQSAMCLKQPILNRVLYNFMTKASQL